VTACGVVPGKWVVALRPAFVFHHPSNRMLHALTTALVYRCSVSAWDFAQLVCVEIRFHCGERTCEIRVPAGIVRICVGLRAVTCGILAMFEELTENWKHVVLE